MTKERLHFLLLEDDPMDVEFIEMTIRRAGLVFETTHATDREEFLDAITHTHFDIVLADNSLPQFNSVEALELLQEKQPDTPFILVTGTVSEEFAVHIIHLGADDYILKKNMQRLPSAISTAIEKRRITREKQDALKELALSESKYKLLFENSPMPMMLFMKSDYAITDVNKAAVDHYGYSREEFLQMSALDIRPDEEKEAFKQRVDIKIENNYGQGIWRHKKKSGDMIHVEIHAHDHLHNELPARLVLINDVTEKLRIEEKLQETLEETRRLASSLESIREEERARISRDIHDQLGQILTALRIDLSRAKNSLKPEDTLQLERITAAIETTNEVIATVRKIASSLRPALLDDMGLGAALEWQAREFRKNTSIPCFFIEEGIDDTISSEVTIALFRLYQEALTNVSRYAEATKVLTSIKRTDSKIVLNITDNGKGFDVDAVKAKKTLGIVGMKERILLLKGVFDMQSTIGKGTSITVTVNL